MLCLLWPWGRVGLKTKMFHERPEGDGGGHVFPNAFTHYSPQPHI
jgi:hypothetical protein